MRFLLVLAVLFGQFADARVREVSSDRALRDALDSLTPGDTVRLAAGRYQGGHRVANLHGTADQPIVIEGRPGAVPEFIGGGTGLHLVNCSHLTLRHVRFTGQSLGGAVAFTGLDGGSFHHNTIVRPDKWVFRVLQETDTPGFPPCRKVDFHHNLVLLAPRQLNTVANIGANTDPASFTFHHNLWFDPEAPGPSRPNLPAAEADGRYDLAPQLDPMSHLPAAPGARTFGRRPAAE